MPNQTMPNQQNQALEDFVGNADVNGLNMPELLEQDRDEFYRLFLQALRSGEESPDLQDLFKLIVQGLLLVRLIHDLCDPDLFDRKSAISIARKVTEVEPNLDFKLARMLPDRGGAASSGVKLAVAGRLLDLLEGISHGTRVVPLIAPLMQCPDQRLRSKVALMIGRLVKNERLTETMLNEPDPRVRANAVESLWGSDTRSSRVTLQRALEDSNQRVVGNAMYGLYLLQDPNVVCAILKMASDPKPANRATAVWVMGQTGDLRFLPELEKRSSDLYAAVRKTSAKALARVREAEETARAATPVSVSVLRAEKAQGSSRNVWVRIEASDGRFVSDRPHLSFILEEDENLVLDYQVSERHLSERINVGFALCAGTGISPEWLSAAQEAVSSCLQYRRSDDCWATLKLFSDERSVPFAWHPANVKLETDEPIQPPFYLNKIGDLEKVVESDPVRSGSNPAALDAVRLLLPGMSGVRGQRHLIVFGGAELAEASNLHLVSKAAIDAKVAIHVILAGDQAAAIDGFCRSTGGTTIVARTAEGLEGAYKQIYLGLTDRYEITYRPESKLAPAEPSDSGSVRLRVFSPDGYGECRIPLEPAIHGHR